MNFSLRSWSLALGIGVLSLVGSPGLLAEPSPPPPPTGAPSSPAAEPPSQRPSRRPSTPPNRRPGQWQSFRSEEGRFQVLVPEQPVASSQTDSDGDVSHSFKIEKANGFYVVNYFDLARLAEVPPQDMKGILEKMPPELVKSAAGKLTSNRSISLKQHLGQAFDFTVERDGKTSLGKGRIYVVGTRVYMLMSIGKAADIQRFIQSFKLL